MKRKATIQMIGSDFGSSSFSSDIEDELAEDFIKEEKAHLFSTIALGVGAAAILSAFTVVLIAASSSIVSSFPLFAAALLLAMPTVVVVNVTKPSRFTKTTKPKLVDKINKIINKIKKWVGKTAKRIQRWLKRTVNRVKKWSSELGKKIKKWAYSIDIMIIGLLEP